ncbi:hypothetical protein [Mycoplasmopsis pullorum]|uniref:DUF4231 domain-containing protein n=2 Tax=Mycoplasmopsis pullorum TaxID=48003 RepID=A0A1L4FRZ6_9BACT|nr:hypothetical protein [Mycoplasmopsis pullorum]APJ38376.1 hypothetical protein BLA55_01660 [Mycoplasmopsis pullorum]TNK83080.1 hypothetical protein C4M80_01460 [Mycoplasmopsis pullorum]TNK85011.1 hypothetical protein C4M81_00600 [Mycoplasmopsis pullorum]TNK85602.1 hypothetical protein C4M92_00795 [Mycoplasmopsis pullorum]TNK86382.1 hypothetical protein C4M85_00250 [Mycoplasmopsis pullorum]
MKNIINALKKKIDQDRRNLKIYKLLDSFFGTTITICNIVVIVLAILVLNILLQKMRNKDINQEAENWTPFILILILTIFIIANFILTITLSIYKVNMRFSDYQKIRNTIMDLKVKLDAKVINEEELDKYIDVLWLKLKNKNKIVMMNVVKEQLRKG